MPHRRHSSRAVDRRLKYNVVLDALLALIIGALGGLAVVVICRWLESYPQ